MNYNIEVENTNIYQLIIKEKLLDEVTLAKANHCANKEKISLVAYLTKEKLIAAYQLAELIARKFGMKIFNLDEFDKTRIPIDLVNEKILRKHHVLPLWKEGNELYLAVIDPTNQVGLDEIKFSTGLNIKTVLVVADALYQLIEATLLLKQNNKFNELKHQVINETAIASIEKNNSFVLEETDVPIVRYVHKILLQAIEKQASDIHFEIQENNFQIRIRIDGLLYNIANLPINTASRISTRLKIMAELNIAERRIPQDGRFKIELSDKHTIDFRVSTCPTVFGEKIVLRILEANKSLLAINNLGLTDEQQITFNKALKKPHGMILIAGPTGSGKTFTLYSALNVLNDKTVNICTIEDPVEIHLPGINQININSKAGLNFANILRALLRQDPDIIMVGEMRDLETAEIGVKAAQTGHLVFSTVHTSSAVEALTRLSHMGVATYNIANAINLIVAQRLIRKLCEYCKQKKVLSEATLLTLGFDKQDLSKVQLYKPVGCQKCTNGYQGRTGVFELLTITENLMNLIINKNHGKDISQQAIMEGMRTLNKAALDKVKLGLTSLEEVNRVLNV